MSDVLAAGIETCLDDVAAEGGLVVVPEVMTCLRRQFPELPLSSAKLADMVFR
jgi:hypothetical protein